MFNVGDLIIYSAHGICQIDDVSEKTYVGVTKNYYVLHPLQNTQLTISTPVDNKSVVMLELIHKDEAREILESFKFPGIDWIEKIHQREQVYADIVKQGNRKEISKIVNTLMRKAHEAEMNKKKLYEHDRRLLTSIQSILFGELAISLDTTYEEIVEQASNYIHLNE